MRSPTDQHQGVGSTEAQINSLAGGLGNTNVNGTVGPHFFVARLKNEATIVALYGYLLSDECCLGLQGDVLLPEGGPAFRALWLGVLGGKSALCPPACMICCFLRQYT